MSPWHLRPRSAAELVDASIQLLRQHARPLFLIATVLVMPNMLLGLANGLIFGDAATFAGKPPSAAVAFGMLGTMLPLIVLWTSWFLFAFGALVSAAAAGYVDGVVPEPADAFRRVRARLGVLVGSGWLTYLLVIVQFLGVMLALAIVLGIVFAAIGIAGASGSGGVAAAGGIVGILVGIVGVVVFFAAMFALAARYATLPAVGALESLSVTATMRRARALGRGSVARVTILFGIVAVLFLLVTFGTLAILGGVLRNAVAANALAPVFNIPLYAFMGALVAVLYYDLRVRHEGLDIELLADEIAGEAAAAGALGH